jgi:hypothetical protein
MNNNNLYNTNNFIGITHNDYFKTASNALATAINTLDLNSSNYTCNVSNILDNKIVNININSSNYTRNTSNAILARYDPMIENKIELKLLPIPLTLNHTYISNSNLLGEIRFWCKSTSDFIVFEPLGVPDYRVKIDVDGKLKVYYTYDPAINLTFFNGWVDVGNSIAALNASDANIGAAVGGLEAQISTNFNYLEGQITALLGSLMGHGVIDEDTFDSINTTLELYKTSEFTEPNSITNVFRNLKNAFNTGRVAFINNATTGILYNISLNPVTATFLGIGGVAFGFAVGYIQNQGYLNTIAAKINENLNSNVVISPSRRAEALASNVIDMIDTYSELCSNMSNMTISQGYINTYNSNQQYIPYLKSDTLDLNTGNITNINGITANELITSGKIKENNKFLDATYLTSNHLYNLAFNYTAERQYPAKAYTTSSPETTVSLLGKQVYKQTLYLDTTSISYGSGFYEIYSSSTYDNGITDKNKLFNYNTTETTNIPRFGISLYASGTGNYQGNNSIDNVYFGDWIIIKLPQQIMLSRYKIYQSTQNPFPTKAPAEWKCYGSNDGITFTEITEASQMTRLTSYTFGFYEKTLNPSFTTQYQWIGFVFNKLLSTSGQTDLSFVELQIFGKEIISNSIVSNIYATSNAVKSIVRYDMPDVGKRQAFYVSIPITATYYDGTSATTYYKYDLDLRNYTKTQTIALTSDLMRVFKIRFWYVPSYFGSYINSEPYVSSYEVYMSDKLNPVLGRPDTAGLNIYAVGFPENNKLANILPNQLMLLRNVSGSLNYLTIVSRTAPCDIYVIIEDMLY